MGPSRDDTTLAASTRRPTVGGIVAAVEGEEPWQPVAGDDSDAYNPAADPLRHHEQWQGRTVPAC
jgi:hypothetical protein